MEAVAEGPLAIGVLFALVMLDYVRPSAQGIVCGKRCGFWQKPQPRCTITRIARSIRARS
jgi:hypothetical protein